MSNKCQECQRGYCTTCLQSDCDCQHLDNSSREQETSQMEQASSTTEKDETTDGQPTEDDDSEEESDLDEQPSQVSRRQRRNKPDSQVTDQQSTGRKRAARLYPLDRTKPCEWRTTFGKGGGTNPILGCTTGLQQARHHGPDKNTLNNEPGNVHRICHQCHINWHAANDQDYDPNKPLKD